MKALSVVMLAVAACACAPRARVVTARGSAPWDAREPEKSRALALGEAQRRAALEAGQSQVSARTTVDGAVLTRSLTTAVSKVRLADVKTTHETIEDGQLTVTVRARLAEPGERGPLAAPPVRLSVIDSSGCAESALTRAFIEAGLTLSLSPSAAAARAGVSLNGSSRAWGGFWSRRARLTATVTSDDGSVLASTSEEAAGLGSDAAQAGCEAASRAASAAAADISRQLAGL